MSHLTYTNYAGYGEEAKENFHYSQAVRVGDIIELSGQGGWDRTTSQSPADLPAQIAQAFDNVEHALHKAGVATGWKKVFSVRTYHAPMNEESMAACVRELKKYCPGHRPIWTAVGVTRLAFDDMKIEIEVRAHVPVGKEEEK